MKILEFTTNLTTWLTTKIVASSNVYGSRVGFDQIEFELA